MLVISVIEDNDYYWFGCLGYNGLFRLSKESNDCKFVGSYPGHPVISSAFFKNYESNDKIIALPYYGNSVGVYDKINNCFSKIDLEENSFRDSGMPKFHNAFSYNDYVYFLPAYYTSIVRYNTVNNELELLDGWCGRDFDRKREVAYKSNNYNHFFNGFDFEPIIIDECVYLLNMNQNSVVKVRLPDCMMEGEVVHFVHQCNSIAYVMDCIWGVLDNGEIVKINPKTREMVTVLNLPDLTFNNHTNIVYSCGVVYIVNYLTSAVIIVNPSSLEYQVFFIYSKDARWKWSEGKEEKVYYLNAFRQSGNTVLGYDCIKDIIIKWNSAKKSFEKIKQIDGQGILKYLNSLGILEAEYVVENADIGLQELLNVI